MPPVKNRLVLVDGHSNIHKAYHGIKQPLTNAQGEPTSAVFGFLNMFMRLLRDLEFQHIAVVFDPPGPSFRKKVFEAYKANRPPAPEDLKLQEKRIREMLQILQVPVVEKPGFEADDVLACLAIQAVEAGGEALICSSDKDLLQVVRPGIKVWREHLQKVELLDEEGVVGKLGVRPEQVPAYLGLVGDTADNIPGVPGVGAKTATKLLQEYGSMEGILAAAPEIKQKKISENLQQHADTARLSEQLATLNVACVQEAFAWERFAWCLQPSNGLRTFYREMGFRSHLEELGGETVEERTVDYRVLKTRAELEGTVAAILQAGRCAIDTETTDLNPFLADLVGISLSWKKNQAVYLPLGHETGDEQLSRADVLELLGPALEDASVQWIAHNWSFDYKMLVRAGFPPPAVGGDTMVAAYLVNPERGGGPLRLKELAVQRLGIQMTEISELIGDGGDMITMASVSVEDTGQYACQDADVTLQLHDDLQKAMEQAGVEALYRDVEIPLIPVLAEMELEGVRIDRDYFRGLSKEAERRLGELTTEIYEIAGRPFKINSPKQVGELLFDELGLPTSKKGKSGAYSTDVTVLEGLRLLHALPAKLLEYRGVEKLKNTYLDPLPGLVERATGRVHTSYNQTVAATGRLSSSNPNLQNIPVRTEDGRAIRRGFIPREDSWFLLAADYSQIELRILAHLSGDPALVEAFTSGGDIHTLTASKIFGLAPEAVDKTQRGQAKAINFGIIYGMSDFRLSRDQGISREQAREFIAEYFRVYAGVKEWLEATKEAARRDRYVTTLLGRRRFVADINAGNPQARNAAERIAVNTPIQGTSADMIKLAMIRVARRMQREGVRAKMILQVHDELIFDVPSDEVEPMSALVREEMTGAMDLKVPIAVDVEVGQNWSEC